MDPRSLVVGVGDLLRLPFAFVFGVVDHGWFPLAVHLIVPIVGFGGVRVGDVLWLVPVFRLLVILVIDLLTVIPVFWFLGIRVWDVLWLVPVLEGDIIYIRLPGSVQTLLKCAIHSTII